MDLDGDGHNDVLSGSWPGWLYFFRGGPNGEYAAPEKLRDRNGALINVGGAAAVFAADWDGDGDLDLLVGNISGAVHFIANEGSDRACAFGAAQTLQVNGAPIQAGRGDAAPCVADWDGDGLSDLLVGSGDGSVVWYRNIGSRREPSLALAQTLVPPATDPSAGGKPEPSRCGLRTKLCVTDWNEDGRLDLLVGDFHVSRTAPLPLSEIEQTDLRRARQRLSELLAEYRQLRIAPSDETREEKCERESRCGDALKQLSEVRREVLASQKHAQPASQYHGFVWVLVRERDGSGPPRCE